MFREFSHFVREVEKRFDPLHRERVARQVEQDREDAVARTLKKGVYLTHDELDDLESTLENAHGNTRQASIAESVDYALDLVRRIRDNHV